MMDQTNSSPKMALQEIRGSLYNEIVQPDVVFVATQYFRKKWVPRLGTNLAWLILALRQHCYWNKKKGDEEEKRDWCIVAQEELAREIGITVRTLQNLLKKESAGEFILQVKHRYRYDARQGKRIRTSSFYRIRMDDPLVPEDRPVLEKRLQAELAGITVDPETGQVSIAELVDRLSSDGVSDPVPTEPPYPGARPVPELQSWRLAEDEVIVEFGERYWAVPLNGVVAWDLKVGGGKLPAMNLRTACFYSVVHALGEGPEEGWLPEEEARIGRHMRLEEEISQLYQELGAFSLEEALRVYFGEKLARQFLERAREDQVELKRIRAWIAYTRQAQSLRNPAGFLRTRLESDELPPGWPAGDSN